MRICHVIHTFPPFSRAGSENFAEALAREQSTAHAVSVFHRIDASDQPEYAFSEHDSDGIAIARVNRTFSDFAGFEDTYRSERVAGVFGEFLDKWRPDVVHFHHVTCLSTSCVDEASRRAIPIVFTLHDFWLLCSRGQLMRRDLSLCETHRAADCVNCMAYQLRIRGGHARIRNLARRASRFANLPLPKALYQRLASRPFAKESEAVDAIRRREAEILSMCEAVDCFVAPSRFLRDRYIDFGVSPEKIRHSDYGFPLDGWQRPMPDADASRPLRVAYIGTWIPSKGVHVLVEAFRELDPGLAQLDVWGYAVAYDGFDDYETHLRQIAGDAVHIRFRGAYEPGRTPGILAAADVVAVPSIWYENSPLTIHEAFLAGVPVVASGHGGMEELVAHGTNGLTFEPGSARALAQAIRRLADDRHLLERLRAGIPAVKSIAQNAAEMEAIYREIRGDER